MITTRLVLSVYSQTDDARLDDDGSLRLMRDIELPVVFEGLHVVGMLGNPARFVTLRWICYDPLAKVLEAEVEDQMFKEEWGRNSPELIMYADMDKVDDSVDFILSCGYYAGWRVDKEYHTQFLDGESIASQSQVL